MIKKNRKDTGMAPLVIDNLHGSLQLLWKNLYLRKFETCVYSMTGIEPFQVANLKQVLSRIFLPAGRLKLQNKTGYAV